MDVVHYKSLTSLWETPANLFKKVDEEFHFTLDVCALPENAKCKRFFSPDEDGLKQPWDGICWMNPPYGREIGKWMEKAFNESQKGVVVVCLVPARPDTEWWHRFALRGEIRFLRGRLKFGKAKSGAPFPSAIIIFRQRWWEKRVW
jgi:phage N-6-adenine-methyltransferase